VYLHKYITLKLRKLLHISIPVDPGSKHLGGSYLIAYSMEQSPS